MHFPLQQAGHDGVALVVQVRMSTDGDWGSLGGQMRIDEDNAMPAFSDPIRDIKNSPTQSNFSAPDNLQGESTPVLPLTSTTSHMATPGRPVLALALHTLDPQNDLHRCFNGPVTG